MSYDNVYTPLESRWVFRQEQSKLLSRSFLFTGISFFLIFVFSFLLYYLLPQNSSGANVANNFLIISPIFILVSTIMGMFLRGKTHGTMTFTFFVYTLYIIAQSIGIGGLLYAIKFSSTVGLNSGINVIDVASVFGVAGLMFIGMSLIGIKMSRKASAKFSTFIIAATIVWLLSSVVFSVMFIFTPFFGGGYNSNSWFVIVSTLVGGLFNLGYIVFIVSQIKQSSDFVDLVGNRTLTNSLAASYGFWMLVNLMGLVWNLIRLLFIFNR
ncbi:hypothetical protein [Mycoplasmoides alvi]|uniref:hypothetical protein n=1 Tax=Mycoplasmoides alvi TaxID=78580 RepID=UPI00051C270C|nr:hypothetical protein [Mycoplasmoides alvi]